MTPTEFDTAIRTLALSTRGSVTSWLRSPARNAAVGGVSNSLHLLGLAVDMVWDSPKDRQQGIALAARLGLQTILEDDHVHLQIPPR